MRFCECGQPVWGTDKKTGIGYCQNHQWKRTDKSKQTILQKAIAKNALKNEKTKVRGLINEGVNLEMVNKKKELDEWFNLIRSKMTGECECGCRNKTSKDDDKYFKFSAAHLLAKSTFKSVATHPINYLELAFFGGCHTTFDSLGYRHCKNTNPGLWKLVVERFKIIYPEIAEEERKHIPDVLLETLK